ncbi:hypothetical protein K9L16_02150 [Candidatus Pacearchaeota archaeon]|nr:hypothetical protein [Candidatus Pacearchaeota archaeon]
MKKILAFIFALFLLSFLVAGEANENSSICNKFTQEDIENFQIPSFVPFSTEKINLFIEDNFEAGVILEDKNIKEISCLEIGNPSYEVYISNSSIIREFQESKNPLELYNKKIKSKEIIIQSQKFTNSIKIKFLNFLSRILGFFS